MGFLGERTGSPLKYRLLLNSYGLGILQRLRDGRTNTAYDLLEGQLDTAIIGFVNSYRELPPSAQKNSGLKVLQQASDYRAKFPFTHPYAEVDTAVAAAFNILGEKGIK